MNKLIHGLVAVFFSLACLFLWTLITWVQRVAVPNVFRDMELPGLTAFCIQLRPLYLLLPLFALGYYCYIQFRKSDARASWLEFCAASMTILVLITLPTMFAVLSPMVKFIDEIMNKTILVPGVV